MAHPQHTPTLTSLEEAVTVLFCLIDDAYATLSTPTGEPTSRSRGSRTPRSLLWRSSSNSEGCGERALLPARSLQRFFVHLFPGIAGMHPSSLHRRVRKLRPFLEPLRRIVVPELVGDPETLLIGSTLLEVLHPRQVNQSAGIEGAAWVRWGSFALYGVKLHLLCATNRVPISYELTPANVAEVRLVGELIDGAQLGEDLARRLFGDLAYRSEKLGETLSSAGVSLVTERSRQNGRRQQAEIAFSTLKRVFGIERTLAKTLVGLVTRIVAKVTAYTYGFYVNRKLGRAQGRIKDLWA